MMSLFGKKKKEHKPNTADTLQLLQDQISLLEKKQEHLEHQIQEDLKFAKANASKNKKAALAALKRKKLHEDSYNKVQDKILMLQQQQHGIQELQMNVETFGALKQATETYKVIQADLTVDEVDRVRDDLEEQKALAQELDSALSSPMGNDGIDDDELEAELAALEEEDIDKQLAGLDSLPAAPVAKPVAAAAKPALTAAERKKRDEEAELAALEAEMAMFLNAQDGNDNNTCVTAQEACATLGHVLPLVAAGDTVSAVGLFVLAARLTVTVPITLRGGTVASKCVLSQASATGALVFAHGAGVATLSTLTVTSRVATPVTPVLVTSASVVQLAGVIVTNCPGAPLRVEDGSEVTLTGGEVSRNGGPVVVDNATLSASQTNFVTNTGTLCGGALAAANSSRVTLSNLALTGNTAAKGGAVCVRDSSVDMQSVACSFNRASLDGGCAHISSSHRQQSSISGSSVLEQNYAERDGGAVYATGAVSLLVNSALLESNTATRAGGALALNTTDAITLQAVQCAKNIALGNGGCVWSNSSSTLNVEQQCVLRKNLGFSGAGVYAINAHVLLTDSTITMGSASTALGGAFYANGGSLLVSNMLISDNVVNSVGQGAGGYVDNGVQFTVDGASQWINNRFESFPGHGPANETLVCAGSTGAVPTTPVAAEVVCAPGCMVQVAGVPGNSCDGRPRGAPFAASSSVYPPAGGISTYVGQRKSIPALVRDAYGWAVALPTPYVLHVALVNSNGLLTFDSSSVLPGTNVGEYTVYFSAPQADLFSLHVTIDGAELVGSPIAVQASTVDAESASLLWLWISLGIVGALGVALVGALLWRRYGKRRDYAPLADNSSKSSHYGGVGFQTETDSADEV